MHRSTQATIGAALASLVLMASACSSDSGSKGTGTTDAAQLDEAKAAVETHLAVPTEIGITEPLSEAPAAGSLVNITCNASNCINLAEGAEAAAEAAGWEYTQIPFDNTDPATLLEALEDSLVMDPKPTGVTFTGVDRTQWEQIVPKFEEAGIKLVPTHIGDTPLDETVIASIARDDNVENGEMLADWITADSDGKAHVLVMNVPAFPVLKKFSTGFDDRIDEVCSGCQVTHLDAAITDVASGGIPGQIVSLIQKDPSIDYVSSSVGDFASGIDAALQAAGLAEVKLTGNAATAPQRAGIIAGTEAAWTTECFQYNGWQVIDTLLRDMQGLDFDETAGSMPKQLLTKDNLGDDPDQVWCEPADYEDQFKALWLLQ